MIILVLDQFRADYLERYRADFKGKGFKLLLDHGAYFTDCYSSMRIRNGARAFNDRDRGVHGRARDRGNEWWDLARNTERRVTSVEDERYGWWGCRLAARSLRGFAAQFAGHDVGDEVRLDTWAASRCMAFR